jgi:hypothetical protein
MYQQVNNGTATLVRIILKSEVSNLPYRRCVMYAGVYVFIAGTIVVGVGLGFWLQGKLEATDQNIKLPSVYDNAA